MVIILSYHENGQIAITGKFKNGVLYRNLEILQ